MKPSDVLKTAEYRYGGGTPLIDCLRMDVEYPVYCRALFLLKRAANCSPADPLWQEEVAGRRPTCNALNDAIRYAEAFEVAA